MNLGIFDISFRCGVDLLLRDCIKTSWLERTELGDKILNAFGSRFKISVTREGEGESFSLRIRTLLQSVGNIEGFRLRLEFKMPQNFSEFFAPGIFYRDNRYSYAAPSFFISDRWIFREDRLSLRAVAAFDPSNGGLIVVRGDQPKFEPPSVTRRKMCGEFVLPSTDFDIGSLGFDRKKSTIEAFLPLWEGDFRYYEKLKFTPPLGWLFFPLLDQAVEASYLIEFCKGDVYKLLERMIDLAWGHQKRLSVKKPDFVEIEKVLVDSLKTRYFESRKLAGVYSWVDTFTGRPALGVCEPGFTGMVFLSCAKMLDYSKRTGDSQAYSIASKVFDSWCTKAIKNSGFIPDFWIYWAGTEKIRVKPDVPVTFEPPFLLTRHFSVRRASEALWGLIEAIKIESSKLWVEKARVICDKLVSLQKKDGSFPRQVWSSGREREPEFGATPSTLYALCKANKLWNGRYRDVVKRASEFVAKDMVSDFVFYGSTLDSDCEDKEAAQIAAVALWDAAKILDSEELKFAAQKAAVAALSWFFLWDPVLPKDSLLAEAGLDISGLSAVSSENNHVDVYLFGFPSVLTEIAASSGKSLLSEIAELSLNRALEYVPASVKGPFRLGDELVLLQTGVVPEAIYHTDWTYYHLPIVVKSRHLAQGYVNPRSAGWCSASLLEAISSWKKVRGLS